MSGSDVLPSTSVRVSAFNQLAYSFYISVYSLLADQVLFLSRMNSSHQLFTTFKTLLQTHALPPTPSSRVLPLPHPSTCLQNVGQQVIASRAGADKLVLIGRYVCGGGTEKCSLIPLLAHRSRDALLTRTDSVMVPSTSSPCARFPIVTCALEA